MFYCDLVSAARKGGGGGWKAQKVIYVSIRTVNFDIEHHVLELFIMIWYAREDKGKRPEGADV